MTLTEYLEELRTVSERDAMQIKALLIVLVVLMAATLVVEVVGEVRDWLGDRRIRDEYEDESLAPITAADVLKGEVTRERLDV